MKYLLNIGKLWIYQWITCEKCCIILAIKDINRLLKEELLMELRNNLQETKIKDSNISLNGKNLSYLIGLEEKQIKDLFYQIGKMYYVKNRSNFDKSFEELFKKIDNSKMKIEEYRKAAK